MRRALAVLGFAAASLAAAPASAASEGTHGRLDGDMSVTAGLGATFGPRAPRATADLRLRYLSTAGVFATYEDGPLVGSSSAPRRVLAFGVEMRPLFFARWLRGHESGNPYVDLTIDSLGLELGAVFVQPVGGSFGARPGLQAGLGLELPIFPRATGPLVGLHGGVRFSGAALAGRELDGPRDRALYLAVTVAWQQLFGAHVVDLGDQRP